MTSTANRPSAEVSDAWAAEVVS